MQQFSISFGRMDRNTVPEAVLIGCWIAGSSLGLWAGCLSRDLFELFLDALPGTLPGFGGMFASALFPLLLSACAVVFFRSAGCYGICLVRGLSQGFLLGLIGACYGSAAPLLAFLLVFTGLMVNGVLFFFWLRRLQLGMERFGSDLLLCGGLCLLIGVTDVLAIAPFLADIIIF